MVDSVLLRKVQLAQLEIAKEIKRVCERNHIQYFMDSGTFTGAVRHKGFIPWDDDMDFGMINSEYERFIKIAPKELAPEFYLQTWETDHGYPFAFAKVLKKGTLYVEDVFQKANKRNELYVDIFSYYVYPNTVFEQKKQKMEIQCYKHLMMMKDKMVPWVRSKNRLGKFVIWIKYLPFIVISKFVKREWIIKKYTESLKQFNHKKTKWYFEEGIKYGEWLVPRKCFDSYEELQFEDTVFMAPKNSKLYLRCAYGDYMKLPPIEERENRHNIVKIKI